MGVAFFLVKVFASFIAVPGCLHLVVLAGFTEFPPEMRMPEKLGVIGVVEVRLTSFFSCLLRPPLAPATPPRHAAPRLAAPRRAAPRHAAHRTPRPRGPTCVPLRLTDPAAPCGTLW